MSNKKVIITGGSHNIGAAIAEKLYKEGFETIVLDINEPESSLYVDHFYKVDFSNREQAQKIVKEAVNEHKPLNLINNVGIVQPASLNDTSLESLDLLMNINALSALICLQALAPIMKKAGYGRVISTISRTVLGKELRTAYVASKGAIQSMSRTWALELAENGITVNCVAPGPIATTAFWENNPPESEQFKKIINGVPMKKMGSPKDVANAINFFVSEDTSFITGQTIYVCGGITVGLAH
jgi:3-oxoacyl-[acyl-carrier protein] reductase